MPGPSNGGAVEANILGDRTTRSDWLAWETAREPLERAIPAFQNFLR